MRYLKDAEEKEARKFLDKACQIAANATCKRAQCGSIIVKNGEVIGVGFNSPPGNVESERRCECSKDAYDKKVTDKTCCIHAEQRAVFDALRKNSDKVIGSRLYFTRLGGDSKPRKSGEPYCTICSKTALDVGIKEFVLDHEAGVCVYDTEEYNTLSFAYQSKF